MPFRGHSIVLRRLCLHLPLEAQPPGFLLGEPERHSLSALLSGKAALTIYKTVFEVYIAGVAVFRLGLKKGVFTTRAPTLWRTASTVISN
jgi:hypothetical protein